VSASAQLTESSSNRQVWARRYNTNNRDFFDIQDELAVMGNNVGAALIEIEQDRIRDIPLNELDSWELMVLANNTLVKDGDSRNEQLSLLRRAMEKDTEFAAVHATLALRLTQIVTFSLTHDEDKFKTEAISLVDRALSLTSTQVFVLNQCSYVHRVIGSVTLALELAEKVDNITGGGTSYALYPALIANGQAEKVVELATNNRNAHPMWSGDAYVIAGYYDKAEQAYRKFLADAPGSLLPWACLANVLGHLDRMDEAMDAIGRVKHITPQWTPELQEKGLRINWRDKDDIVNPLIDGIKKLRID